MKFLKPCTTLKLVVFGAIAFSFIQGCGRDYRALDEEQLRRQFHLDDEVQLDTLISNPETGGGWFGREGLRIRGVFRFTPAQYESYCSRMYDSTLWTAVSFLHYSPDGAESSSARALRWEELPLPELPPTLAHLHGMFDSTLRRGWYYCNVVVYHQGERIDHGDGHYHYVWETSGIHGCELRSGWSAVITTFGILDHRSRRLYTWIGFSG